MAEKEFIVPVEDIGVDGAYFGYTELIRCKDCKYSLHNQFTGDWFCWLYNIARKVESDGFCYKAERKEE